MVILPRRPVAGTAARSPLHALRGIALVVCAAAATAMSAAVAPLAAQEGSVPSRTGTIVGTVTAEGGLPVAGAQVQVLGLLGRGVTGEDGTFTMGSVPAGEQQLLVRRLGFRPDTTVVEVQPGAEVRVEVSLTAVAQRIDAVVVEADPSRQRYTGRLAGFWERRARGTGRYFTAEDIDRRQPALVSDLLRQLPGVRFEFRGGQQLIYFRGERCTPTIFLDGMAASLGYLDPDNFSPESLAGIEVYAGPATIPVEMMRRDRGTCGVIALWTRLDEPRRRQRPSPVTATELADLVRSLSLYTADQVDVGAQPDSSTPLSPVYPDSLLRAGVSGQVLVEVVVDTTGAPDMSTFGVILSTNPLFTAAVRRAVVETSFSPALLDGRTVRQLVQLPFRFVAPERAGARH